VRSALSLLQVAGMAAAACLLACGGDSQPELSPDVVARADRRAEWRERLTGTWARRVRTNDSLWEGLRFDPDGRFGLFGIQTLHGLQWLVRADTLILTTTTERYAQPQESRLEMLLPDEDSLELLGVDYLAGTYERTHGMARRLTGTVNCRSDIPAGSAAALFLELRAGNAEAGSDYLASQTLPVEDRHAPVSFHVYYAVSDLAASKTGWLLVTLVVDGVPVRNLEPGLKVDLSDDVDDVEVSLDQPES